MTTTPSVKREKSVGGMASSFHRSEFLRMYRELTDDDVIAANKLRYDRQKRMEDRKADTGAYEPKKNQILY